MTDYPTWARSIYRVERKLGRDQRGPDRCPDTWPPSGNELAPVGRLLHVENVELRRRADVYAATPLDGR